MFSLTVDADLHLRQLTVADAKNLFDLIAANYEYLSRWLPEKELFKTQAEVSSALNISAFMNEERGDIDAGIWYKEQLCGVVSLRPDWQRHQSALAYWLDVDYQHQGLVTRAVRALVDYAFEEYGLKRLEMHCGVDNVRSRAIPERLGFRLDRIEPNAAVVNGEPIDHAIYGMSESEWRAEPHPVLARRQKTP